MLSRFLVWPTWFANTSTPRHRVTHVNQLPPELLGEIFKQLPLYDRIRAATVCKFWRSLALDHGDLWCDLHNVDIAVLPHLLSRTKQAGIRLTGMYCNSGTIQRPLWRITPHMAHMKYLDLHIQPEFNIVRDDPGDLVAFLRAPAPALETFILVLHRFQFPVDFPLFDGVAPKLRTLRMEGWRLQAPSGATRNVTSLRAPGMDYHLPDPDFAFITTAWSQMFPNVRDLHLSKLSGTTGLWGMENRFPSNLTTLVLELTQGIVPRLRTEPFALLKQAMFTNLRELTVVRAHADLVDLVLGAVKSVISLELLGYGGSHLRLITSTGAAINFMNVYIEDLNETILKRSNIFEGLRELHLDELVPHAFQAETIAHICVVARGLQLLHITLRKDRTPHTLGLLLHPTFWQVSLLSLRSLQELRIEGAPQARVWTDELAEFVCQTMRVSSQGNVPRLALVSVEIVYHREWCAIRVENLSRICEAHFDEIKYVPEPRALRVKRQTQRAELFLPPSYEYTL